MTLNDACERDYQVLLRFIAVSYSALESEGRAATRTGDHRGVEIARQALSAVLESGLNAINAHADSTILSAALATGAMPHSPSTSRAPRADRLLAIRNHTGHDLTTSAGWEHVERTNRECSLLKHRGGLSMTRAIDGKLHVEAVDLSLRDVLERIDDVQDALRVALAKLGLRPTA